MTNKSHGLVRAYILDGRGGGRAIESSELDHWSPEHGCLWAHFDRTKDDAVAWVRHQPGLPPPIADALISAGSRPRVLPVENGALIVLRGINHNPGTSPEDMVSIRIWVDGCRLLSFRSEKLVSPEEIASRLERGRGPRTTAELLVDLIELLTLGLDPVIEALDERLDDIESHLISEDEAVNPTDLSEVRRRSIALRRYLAPQREALNRLYLERLPWLEDTLRSRLREMADRVTRYVEDTETCRERAAVAKDELFNRLSVIMNKRLYVLGLVTAIFLPLGLITGLLGVNVAGIPGADNPRGFLFVCALLVVLALGEMYLLWRHRWF